MAAMDYSVNANVAVPTVSKVTLLPPVHVKPVIQNGLQQSNHGIQGRNTRVTSRAAQLALRRSLTFGLIGEDSQTYPSSQWQSENRGQYLGETSEDHSKKPDFVITSLDTRKHKPQTTQIFHIKRINKKPVCSVQWADTGTDRRDVKTDPNTVYSVSYQQRPHEPRHLVLKNEKEKSINGNPVPVNVLSNNNDVRTEMMLPVCDSTMMQSAHNPHRYLLRKRKVPPPHKPCGVVYPVPENPVLASLPSNRPQSSATAATASTQVDPPDRVSVSSLSGYAFTRRKFIPPPTNHIMSGFDGGVPEKTSGRFGDNLMPFMRNKSII